MNGVSINNGYENVRRGGGGKGGGGGGGGKDHE